MRKSDFYSGASLRPQSLSKIFLASPMPNAIAGGVRPISVSAARESLIV